MGEQHAKAIEAVAAFCRRKGYEVLATGWESPSGQSADIVAVDEGVICFIEVAASDCPEEGFGDAPVDRSAWERAAAAWLAANAPEDDARIRFDRCDILILGEGRALLRYCTNALSEG